MLQLLHEVKSRGLVQVVQYDEFAASVPIETITRAIEELAAVLTSTHCTMGLLSLKTALTRKSLVERANFACTH